MSEDALEKLARACGIAGEYEDIWGKRHRVGATTRRALLRAMGVLEGEDARAALARFEDAAWRRPLPPFALLRRGEAAQVELTLPQALAERPLRWRLELEGGDSAGGEFRAADLPPLGERKIGGVRFLRHGLALPEIGESGYHRLEITHGEAGDAPQLPASMTLAVAPARCYWPEALAGKGRVWGPAVQLYAVRSQRNWGMGDFSDLKTLMGEAAARGAGIVGVNPLHALFPDHPADASPYSPSSRRYWNVLYLDVEAIEDYAECEAARALVGEEQFQARLRALRGADLVDYPGVAALKFQVLALLYRHFRAQHLAGDSARGHAFRNYQREQGEALRRHALFEALQAHFRRQDAGLWGWPVWPQAWRNPGSPEVAEFAAAHGEAIEYYEYLQWQAECQLHAVGLRSYELGLGVGLYQDLAVGAAPGGAETWAEEGLYAEGAHIGAPPDHFNLNGQDWGLPPFIPQRLREAAYEPYIAALRANMRHAGALRIDHVMGLMRLFWVPKGGKAVDGAYVAYPLDEMLGILALESQRNRCMVIGEDLGTVPREVREALEPLGVLSYRPLFFEKDADGGFKPPRDYPAQALVAVSTHDLPTLAGYWLGHDLDLRERLDLFPSDELRHEQVIGRAQDRARLLVALEREGLLPAGATVHPVANPVMTEALCRAIHRYLARSPAKLMLVQPEDFLGQVEQVNLPASTAEQHPNWRRRLALPLEAWPAEARVTALAEALREERPARATAPAPAPRRRLASRVPRATYRLQLHRGFSFRQAAEIVPYLARLGVSHVYASPCLKARAGSNHGYDIIDHSSLNPEIGSAEDFDHLVERLHAHGLGLMLDVVPNHMGVMGADNCLWLDVLENGPASPFAEYFDIDWEPLKEDLRGKVLLPVLGDHYGRVLEAGEIRLAFDAARGEFDLHYYGHCFPVDPREYPQILGHELARLGARLGARHPDHLQLQSLIAAFGHLPPREADGAERRAERSRDKEFHKRQLAVLCAASRDIALFIEENLAALNGRPGEPASFDALHALIKAQAYRLANWRVASDEINYRRFFDVNDLAALRMERDEVFEATHRLVFEQLAQGKADALRIDHPDGLYDPGEYFRRLQARFAEIAGERPGQARPLYLVVEKILAEHERPPEDWPIHGTTGYRFANVLNGLFVDTGAEQKLDRIYAKFIGTRIDFDELLYRCKRLIIRTALASEMTVLTNALMRIALADRYTCDHTANNLRHALTEVVACFPVYRTYVTAAGLSEQDRRHIEWAVARAKKRSPAADPSTFDFVREVLTAELGAGKSAAFRAAVLAFAMKFQQYTAPVMAKGMEDTSFYNYNRLVSLNEVGGDPRSFGFTLAAFHGASQDRARNWPHTLLATSTHDSKRSEDVRARIDAISEMPAAWRLSLTRWSRLNRSKKIMDEGEQLPSRNDEYLLYQTLIGAWPLELGEGDDLTGFAARIKAYMVKAAREAKAHTSWITPNPRYEAALTGFVDALLDTRGRNLFLADFIPAQRRMARLGLYTSLAQTLVKLTSPGVPDLYQGNELFDFSLVDPDNRRAVDFARRAALLEEVAAAGGEGLAAWARSLLDSLEDGRAKLYLTWRALELRRSREALFRNGDYAALAATGAQAHHLCAFARVLRREQAVTVAPRFFSRLTSGEHALPLGEAVWADTAVELPGSARRWVNVLTGETLEAARPGARIEAARLFAHFPAALLVPAATGRQR